MAFSLFKNKTTHHWAPLTSMEQLDQVQAASFTKPQLIFKHSTTCSISKMVYGRMESGTEKLEDKVDISYLDLLSYRAISNAIAGKWNVEHESPQILLIKNGEAVYHASHNMIMVDEIKNYL
jgi:bacillithiol system protein YtxJ